MPAPGFRLVRLPTFSPRLKRLPQNAPPQTPLWFCRLNKICNSTFKNAKLTENRVLTISLNYPLLKNLYHAHMAESKSKANSRKELRRRALKGARILCPDSSTTYDCRIRDMSESGARLEIDQWQSFPKNIIIEIGRRELIEARYEAEIRWTNGNQIGVEFLQKLPE